MAVNSTRTEKFGRNAYGHDHHRTILARASGATQVKPGDLVVVSVDTIVLNDGNFFPAYWRDTNKVKNPNSVVVVFDHRVYPRQGA